MRDINDIDPLPKLGALVVREPVAEPAKPIDLTRWCASDFRATTTTIEREGSYKVTRRWYDGRVISSMYERATPEDDAHLERFSSFIVGSTEPMPSGVVEAPAAVLSQAEVKALAEEAAYLQGTETRTALSVVGHAIGAYFAGRLPQLTDLRAGGFIGGFIEGDGSGLTD
jgi:hypothetical protein